MHLNDIYQTAPKAISCDGSGYRRRHPSANPGIPAYVLGAGQTRRKLHDDITVINWDEFVLEELEVFE